METKQNIGIGLKIIIGICGAMLIALVYFAIHPANESGVVITSLAEDKAKAEEYKEDSLAALCKVLEDQCETHIVELEEMVKARLAFPLTAKFGIYKFSTGDINKGIVAWTGTVVSQNAYGVPSQYHFGVQLKVKGMQVSVVTFDLLK